MTVLWSYCPLSYFDAFTSNSSPHTPIDNTTQNFLLFLIRHGNVSREVMGFANNSDPKYNSPYLRE